MHYLTSSNKGNRLELKEIFSYWIQSHNLIYNLFVSINLKSPILTCLKGTSSHAAVRGDSVCLCPHSEPRTHSNIPSGNQFLKFISWICSTILRIMYLALFELHNTAISCREELCCQSQLPFATANMCCSFHLSLLLYVM